MEDGKNSSILSPLCAHTCMMEQGKEGVEREGSRESKV